MTTARPKSPKFAALPDVEKLRRINHAVASGRMSHVSATQAKQFWGLAPPPAKNAGQIVRDLGAIKTRPGEGQAVARNRRIAYLVTHTDAINAAQKGPHGERVKQAVEDAVGVPRHPDLGQRFAHDLVMAGRNTLLGPPTIALAIGKDYRDVASGRARQPGYEPRTKRIVKAMSHAVVQDVKHPLRHPGNTLLDLTAFGVGSASRLGQAGAAIRAARAGAAEKTVGQVGRAGRVRIMSRRPEVRVPLNAYYRAKGEPAELASARARAGETAFRQTSLRARSRPQWIAVRTQETSRARRAATAAPTRLALPQLPHA